MSIRRQGSPPTVALVALALVIPLALMLNVWQGYRFQELRRETVGMEAQQREWLEQNKRAIAAIEVYLSPARLADLAQNQLDLVRLTPESLETVRLAQPPGATEEETLWMSR